MWLKHRFNPRAICCQTTPALTGTVHFGIYAYFLYQLGATNEDVHGHCPLAMMAL